MVRFQEVPFNRHCRITRAIQKGYRFGMDPPVVSFVKAVYGEDSERFRRASERRADQNDVESI